MALDRRDTIDALIESIEHSSGELGGIIYGIGQDVYKALRFIDRQEDLTDEEYGQYIKKVYDALYPYLEFAHYLKQDNSEIGNTHRMLAAFARGEVSVEDMLRFL